MKLKKNLHFEKNRIIYKSRFCIYKAEYFVQIDVSSLDYMAPIEIFAVNIYNMQICMRDFNCVLSSFALQNIYLHFSTESEVVPKVVEAILNIPENTHIAVRHTSVLLLGELCEWIEKHPETLDPILSFLVCCLPQHGIGAAAATALQNICAACNDHMPRHIPVLLQLLHQVDTFAITNNAVIGLLKGVAAIVGCMPHVNVTPALRELCLMQVNPICQLIEQDVIPVRGTKTDPVLWLDRLSSVFRHVVITVAEGEFSYPYRYLF